MKAAGNAVALATLLFLIIRILGSLIPGIAAEIAVTLLAVALPALLLFAIGALGGSRSSLLPPRRSALAYLPLLPVFILAVGMLAILSTWLAELTGLNRTAEPSGPLPLVILTSALLPALAEELFCRHLCLRPFCASRPAAVWLSASVFAALHMNIAQIPYAFGAGLFLGALTVASGSIWLAVLFHFANNLLSILFWYFPSGSVGFAVVLALCLSALAASLPLLLRKGSRAALRGIWQNLRPGRSDWRAVGGVFLSFFSAPILCCLFFSFI